MKDKAIIVSAPSGAGKTTIVRRMMAALPILEFSVSACSRLKRENETDGIDYYFITPEAFRDKIEADEFVEWEEVYPQNYYGTLKSELTRIWKDGKIPIFDVDVVGGLNLKKYFGEKALAIFIRPPSVEELELRLRNRGSETEETLAKRIGKAKQELEFADKFDRAVVNHDLDTACREMIEMVNLFLFNRKEHEG